MSDLPEIRNGARASTISYDSEPQSDFQRKVTSSHSASFHKLSKLVQEFIVEFEMNFLSRSEVMKRISSYVITFVKKWRHWLWRESNVFRKSLGPTGEIYPISLSVLLMANLL
jgi:hypothetical protein